MTMTVRMLRQAAFLAALVALVASLAACGDDGSTTTTVTTPAETTSSGAATPTGPAVADLQRVMTRLGYYSGPIDGVYGDATTEGVKEMQTDLGVTPDGIYGEATHTALKEKGKYIVVEIQTALTEYGYYSGPIDGTYGQATVDAVMQLQTDLGLTADGRFGPETAQAFNEAVANGTIKPA
jgi:peptidoglycan hydrolase-like protein with peptidoglycan-binding domain